MTFGDDVDLPRVPLPTLEESCARFVEWSAPLLTEDELAATTHAVTSFLAPDSPARTVHETIERREAGNDPGSWLDEFWEDRYLGRRDPIALNANYFVLLQPVDGDQVERAARLIAAIVDYKQLLDIQRVDPDTDRGRSMSMEQHKFLFSTTRIPGPWRDTLRSTYSVEGGGPSIARHVVVFFDGYAFRMEVIAANNQPHTVTELIAGLISVMSHPALTKAPRTAVGNLTTKPRAAWAQSRAALIDCHPRNAAALEVIESALFCVCLEQTEPASTLEACDQLLHGDCANRWFDKSVSLVVFADGTAGFNFEHAGLDGATIVSFLEALELPHVPSLPGGSTNAPPALVSVEPIAFEVDTNLREDVTNAGVSFAKAAANTATSLLSRADVGSTKIKRLGVSPDAFVQMTFQLAHMRARGTVGATYESVSMRHFHHGRVEAMRVVSPESIRFVTAMESADHDLQMRRTAFLAAVDKHVERTRECKAGLAPEQHLWELLLFHRRHGVGEGLQQLDLYDSPGWSKMRADYLSTSSSPTDQVQYTGFGPTSTTCIGLAYMLLPDRFSLFLSAPGSLAAEMHRFVDEVGRAFDELILLSA